jgi:hypothetical protein
MRGAAELMPSHIAARARDVKHLMGVVRMMGDTSPHHRQQALLQHRR